MSQSVWLPGRGPVAMRNLHDEGFEDVFKMKTQVGLSIALLRGDAPALISLGRPVTVRLSSGGPDESEHEAAKPARRSSKRYLSRPPRSLVKRARAVIGEAMAIGDDNEVCHRRWSPPRSRGRSFRNLPGMRCIRDAEMWGDTAPSLGTPQHRILRSLAGIRDRMASRLEEPLSHRMAGSLASGPKWNCSHR